jgi:hypothetical protein
MEMCPVCGKISNMIVSTSVRIAADSSGAKKKIKTTSYQCELCHQFIRSENKEDGTEDRKTKINT